VGALASAVLVNPKPNDLAKLAAQSALSEG
jgi:hypothetical protein